MTPQRFSYSRPNFPGFNEGLPFLPITLENTGRSISCSGLVDSGSTVNVLPYDIGLNLGLIWEIQEFYIPLIGILKNEPAYGVILSGKVEPFTVSKLVFAWTRKTSDEVPLILGQTNFFQEFRVSFDGKSGIFEIIPYPSL